MTYKVASSYELEVFEQDVNKLLADGWQLHGSIAVARSEGEKKWLFVQSMARDDEKPEGVDFVSSGEKQGFSKLKGF